MSILFVSIMCVYDVHMIFFTICTYKYIWYNKNRKRANKWSPSYMKRVNFYSICPTFCYCHNDWFSVINEGKVKFHKKWIYNRFSQKRIVHTSKHGWTIILMCRHINNLETKTKPFKATTANIDRKLYTILKVTIIWNCELFSL